MPRFNYHAWRIHNPGTNKEYKEFYGVWSNKTENQMNALMLRWEEHYPNCHFEVTLA